MIILIILKARASQKYPGWVKFSVINGEPGVDLSSWFGLTMLPKSFQSGHLSQVRSVCYHTNPRKQIYICSISYIFIILYYVVDIRFEKVSRGFLSACSNLK